MIFRIRCALQAALFNMGSAVHALGGTGPFRCLSRRLRFCRGVALTIATCAYAATASADYSCRVSVSGVLQYYEGSINVMHSGRGDWTYVCNMNAPRTNGVTVSPTTCANWFVLLLRAKKNNQPVEFWFPGTGSCPTIGTYGDAPVPVYIGEVN